MMNPDQQFSPTPEPVEQPANEHGAPPVRNTSSLPVVGPVPQLQPIPLVAPVITIGRFPNNMVVLDHPLVSGYHARLERVRSGNYRVIDLGSTNHVFVNGQQVRVRELHPEDTIRIGPFSLVYTGKQLVQEDGSYSIRVDAVHLKTSGRHFHVLLHDISLDIPARSFVAIVGSSGVGKSKLLNALSGVQPARRGRVLYNGQDYYRNLASFNTQIGYVPQDDIVHPDLTVAQALYYTAKMRLPKDFTRSQIRQRIDEVLDEVEIRHRRNHLVKNLSGGERKRVSIALELLANPSIFFLDEPTTGLDPGLDRRMIQLLRKLADKGHTIVLVTHATNDIHYCDYVCFLAMGGRMAFYGPPTEALAYFGTRDYAEIYNALEPGINGDRRIPAEAEENFKRSPYYRQYVKEPVDRAVAGREALFERMEVERRPRRARPRRQFGLLTRRYIRLLTHDPNMLMTLLLQAPIIGLLLFYLAASNVFTSTGITYCPLHADPVHNTGPIVSINCENVVDLLKTPAGQAFAQHVHLTPQQVLENAIAPNSGVDAETLLFIMAFAAVMFGCLNGVNAIVRETPIYRRERMVNLGIAPYMFSKIAVLGFFCLLQSAILLFLVNAKAPFHQGIFLPVLLEVYITLALTSLGGLMLGLAVSALARNADRAVSYVPLVVIPQVIFSGVIFKLDSPFLQAIGALFSARWAMAAMGSSLGLHGDKLGVDSFSFQGTHFVTLNPADARPGATEHLLICWGALAAIIVVLLLATAFFLKRKDVRA